MRPLECFWPIKGAAGAAGGLVAGGLVGRMVALRSESRRFESQDLWGSREQETVPSTAHQALFLAARRFTSVFWL